MAKRFSECIEVLIGPLKELIEECHTINIHSVDVATSWPEPGLIIRTSEGEGYIFVENKEQMIVSYEGIAPLLPIVVDIVGVLETPMVLLGKEDNDALAFGGLYKEVMDVFSSFNITLHWASHVGFMLKSNTPLLDIDYIHFKRDRVEIEKLTYEVDEVTGKLKIPTIREAIKSEVEAHVFVAGTHKKAAMIKHVGTKIVKMFGMSGIPTWERNTYSLNFDFGAVIDINRCGKSDDLRLIIQLFGLGLAEMILLSFDSWEDVMRCQTLFPSKLMEAAKIFRYDERLRV